MITNGSRNMEEMMLFVTDVVLNTTKNFAIVIDQYQDQWFCQLKRPAHMTPEEYLLEVFLYFLHARKDFFVCDVA